MINRRQDGQKIWTHRVTDICILEERLTNDGLSLVDGSRLAIDQPLKLSHEIFMDAHIREDHRRP